MCWNVSSEVYILSYWIVKGDDNDGNYLATTVADLGTCFALLKAFSPNISPYPREAVIVSFMQYYHLQTLFISFLHCSIHFAWRNEYPLYHFLLYRIGRFDLQRV